MFDNFHIAPSSPTAANTDAFILSKKQQSFSSQLAAELSWVLVLAGLVWYGPTCVMRMCRQLQKLKWNLSSVPFLHVLCFIYIYIIYATESPVLWWGCWSCSLISWRLKCDLSQFWPTATTLHLASSDQQPLLYIWPAEAWPKHCLECQSLLFRDTWRVHCRTAALQPAHTGKKPPLLHVSVSIHQCQICTIVIDGYYTFKSVKVKSIV